MFVIQVAIEDDKSMATKVSLYHSDKLDLLWQFELANIKF